VQIRVAHTICAARPVSKRIRSSRHDLSMLVRISQLRERRGRGIIDRIVAGTDNKRDKGSTQASEGARNETLVSGDFFGSQPVGGCAR
jgi:hypothetical protein